MTHPAAAQTRPGPAGSTLDGVSYAELPGWAEDDHAAAFAVFRGGCDRLLQTDPVLRPGLPPPDSLLRLCREALDHPPAAQDSRAWFETHFRAWRVRPAEGTPFLTGYYEPEIPGSLAKTSEFTVPALGRPDDLETLRPGQTAPGLDTSLAAARRTPAGLEPYPDRAAIEDGALDGKSLELLWLPDRVELFLAQVQGSARIVLPDGSVRRLVYAGRNGWPYTSIGRVIVAEGHMDLETMTLARLKAWLRAHPDDARRIMRLNRSYIFFALGDGMDPAAGPIGAASVPLTPWRSIAVDRGLWPYGMPVWLDLELPTAAGAVRPFRALTVAQDTGSAIVGPARADLFCGWGEEAGVVAGQVRHRPGFVVLLPAADGE